MAASKAKRGDTDVEDDAPASSDGADGEEGSDAAWRERAIERSTRTARQRAAKRVQEFLDATRAIIEEKHSIEFTVHEVVERSGLSLRSFYQYFDGKHELLLALFEEEMSRAVDKVKAATVDGDPLDRLERAVTFIYDLCTPDRASEQPLFYEFAQRLLVNHPDDVTRAYAPLFEHIVAMTDDAAGAGLLREGSPRRMAAIVLQAATTTAGRTGATRQPITSEEMWSFCLHAIAPDDVAKAHQGSSRRS